MSASRTKWKYRRHERSQRRAIRDHVDAKPRSYRDVKAVAIEAAIFLKEHRPTTEVSVRDLRDNSVTNIGWEADRAFAKTPPGVSLACYSYWLPVSDGRAGRSDQFGIVSDLPTEPQREQTNRRSMLCISASSGMWSTFSSGQW